MNRLGRRIIAVSAALAMAAASALAVEPDPAPRPVRPPDDLMALFQASDAAAKAGDPAGAEARLLEASKHPAFSGLPARVQARMFEYAAQYARERQDRPAAHALARRATEADPSSFDSWHLRAVLASSLGEHDDAALSGRQAYLSSPEQASQYGVFLSQLVWSTGFESPARYQLLQALFDGGFEFPMQGNADALWHELAIQHLARGNADAAREATARITDPTYLVRLLVDRRFDAIRDPALTTEALPRYAHLRVADLRTRAILDPDVLEIQQELASAMLVAGQHEDVVALADEVSRALGSSVSKSGPYRDGDQYLGWFLDRAGEALERLGRREEALATYRRAASSREFGSTNVSQLLNLGHHLVTAGRPREAMEIVGAVGSMSPYGRMVLVHVQLRAAHALGDQDGVEAALDYLRRNNEHGRGVLAEALFDLGEIDAAAQQLVARLEDPETRSEALYSIQAFPDVLSLDTDPEPERERWEAMLAREDVAAAIERHGRRLALPIHRPW